MICKIPKIEEKIIPLKRDNEFFEGMKILHLSDLHISRKSDNKAITRLIKEINEHEFDFVFCTGDFIDDKVELIVDKIRLFKNIICKIYFVSGNHDIFFGYSKLKKVFEEIGVIIVDNKVLELKYRDKSFNLIGFSDRFSKFFGIKRDEKALLESLDKRLPTIFLVHQPKDYKYVLSSNAALMLCGHTHGGQIFPFHLVVKLAQKYLSGIYYNKDLTIYVNRGLGTWGIHKRVLSNAEIPILKLTSFR